MDVITGIYRKMKNYLFHSRYYVTFDEHNMKFSCTAIVSIQSSSRPYRVFKYESYLLMLYMLFSFPLAVGPVPYVSDLDNADAKQDTHSLTHSLTHSITQSVIIMTILMMKVIMRRFK